MEKKIEDYVARMTEVRTLSTLSLEGIASADDYSVQLLSNFARIGELATENRAFLDQDVFPLLDSESALLPSQIAGMNELERRLIDAESVEILDLPLAKRITDKLVDEAEESGGQSSAIREMDRDIESCYAMMSMVERIHAYPELCAYFRDQGFEIGAFFLELREKERFAAIEDVEERELVLTNARYASAFYENYCGSPEANRMDLLELETTLQIANDSFYRELVPDFDWDYYRYRTLQYISLTTTYCNMRGFTADELEKIAGYTEELWELWCSNPEHYQEYDTESHVKLSLYLNRYLTGKISARAYEDALLELYWHRDVHSYDEGGITENILLPTELMCLFRTTKLTQENMAYIEMLCRGLADYVFCMPNGGTFTFMMEYLSHFIEHYIELPGGVSFEEMMIDLLAALHPPTYVHTQMVAHITECLCGHLLRLRPELFVGVCDCTTAEEVTARDDELRFYAYHAALCHDVGKVFVMDTIFVYGRNLLDLEFDIIKTHPETGARLLEQHLSTKDYADVARGHHRWHDNSRGYPVEFDTSSSPVKTIIDLTTIADCLDAATDTIGRSYKKGKQLDEVAAEFAAGAGTQYADWVVALFEDPGVKEDLTWLLSSGREILYRETYRLLRSVHEQGA